MPGQDCSPTRASLCFPSSRVSVCGGRELRLTDGCSLVACTGLAPEQVLSKGLLAY